MVEDVHKVGEEVINEAMYVEELEMQTKVMLNKKGGGSSS